MTIQLLARRMLVRRDGSISKNMDRYYFIPRAAGAGDLERPLDRGMINILRLVGNYFKLMITDACVLRTQSIY